jgi:hypothetical protein
MQIKNSIATIKVLNALHPGGIQTNDLLWPLFWWLHNDGQEQGGLRGEARPIRTSRIRPSASASRWTRSRVPPSTSRTFSRPSACLRPCSGRKPCPGLIPWLCRNPCPDLPPSRIRQTRGRQHRSRRILDCLQTRTRDRFYETWFRPENF